MSMLKVNYESLSSVSSHVLAKGEEFTDLLNKIRQLNGELQSAWVGTDASAYTTAVEQQAAEIQRLAETINEIGTFLEKVNNEYRNAQEANKRAIG